MHYEAQSAEAPPLREPTPISHEEIRNYDYRVIVAGTRGYDDYKTFSEVIDKFVVERIPKDKSVVFLSGKARTGADAMIIRWCTERGFPWAEFPAQWDDLEAPGAVVRRHQASGRVYNVNAGFARNEEMATYGTNLIAFWDNKSSGTKDMRQRALKYELRILTILINAEY